ncbi:MAG TPA: hypothetical protein VM686_30595 [Polyangiaceae bacterium]|jgi:hypothetical protein|nr:hypothetical protein [Polyangiaceae bacterium]
MRFALGLAVGLLISAAAGPLAAQDERDAARDAYNAGTLAFENGDFGAALVQFRMANDLIPTPHALYWIARTLDKLDRHDEAVKAYEDLLAHPDASKLGDDKLTTARNRLAALKGGPGPEASAEPLPGETPAEQAPIVDVPTGEQAPPPERTHEFRWKNHLFEIGVITGPLFLNASHNLIEEGYDHADYSLAWLLGVRAGYYPIQFVGIELDYAHGWAHVKETSTQTLGSGGDSAQFNLGRGYVVGQYPIERFVPFAKVGGGVINAKSDRLGNDTDFMLVVGAGAKVAVSKVFTPRLDLHLDMTQKKGGGFSEGIAVHPEILLGIDFTLGR